VEILIAIVLVGILSAVVVVGAGQLTSKGSASACNASLDAARTAIQGDVIAATSGSATFASLVASGSLQLAAGVTVEAGGRQLVGNGWRLTLGGGPAPVLTCSTGTGLALDGVTALPALSFSLRRLSSTYTGSAIRIRRSSDNTQADVPFTSAGALDTTALTTFVGSGSGFVTTWYDQSGYARNAVQTSLAAQPILVTNGVVETINGQPTVRFSGNAYLTVPFVTRDSWTLVASFAATTTDASSSYFHGPAIFGADTNGLATDVAMGVVVNGRWTLGAGQPSGGWTLSGTSTINDGSTRVATQRRTLPAGTVDLWINGASDGASTGLTSAHDQAPSTAAMGANSTAPTRWWMGTMSEVVLYGSSLSTTDRQTVERSQGAYLGITIP